MSSVHSNQFNNTDPFGDVHWMRRENAETLRKGTKAKTDKKPNFFDVNGKKFGISFFTGIGRIAKVAGETLLAVAMEVAAGITMPFAAVGKCCGTPYAKEALDVTSHFFVTNGIEMIGNLGIELAKGVAEILQFRAITQL